MVDEKFETCKFRSDQQIVIGHSCCGGPEIKGFVCFRLNIEPLLPPTCENCDFYHKRFIEEENDENE